MATESDLKTLILASNPVGYFPLGNTLNIGEDLSVNANHGSSVGIAVSPVNAFGIATAMARSTSGGYLTIPDHPSYRGTVITVELMLYKLDNALCILVERGSGNDGWYLFSMGASDGSIPQGLQFILGAAINWNAAKITSLGAGLMHVVVSSTAGKTKAWINGALVYSASAASGSGVQNQTASPITLFSRSGAYPSTAYMAHVAIYDRELTAAEIKSRTDLLMAWESKSIGSSVSWANKETREQAWPGETAAKPVPKQAPVLLWRATEPVLPVDAKLTLGFIRGTITSRSEAVGGRRVVCFGPSLDPVAETVSAADGSYRFDLLWLGREYLIIAMDNPAFQYNPAAADRRKPEVYS